MFPHPQHYPVFNVEKNLLFFTVVPYKCMKCITVRNPTNQTTVGGQWNHSIPLSENGNKTNYFFTEWKQNISVKNLLHKLPEAQMFIEWPSLYGTVFFRKYFHSQFYKDFLDRFSSHMKWINVTQIKPMSTTQNTKADKQ
jgi:hypothetical protein